MEKKKLTKIFMPDKVSDKPLKRSMTGYETEQFILKKNGKLDHSDKLFSIAKKEIDVQKECAKSMIETSCYPAKMLKTSSQSLVDNLITLTDIAHKNNKLLFPFATYFGRNKPSFRKQERYQIKKKILGQDKFKHAGMCCGFHIHYALPRGVFDEKKKFLNYKKNSKMNKTLIDSFNLANAIDPVLTTCAQSSPYVDGRYMAKDSRVILYRGGSFLGYPNGVYSDHRLFGALSPYKATVHELMSTLKRRHQKWKSLLTQHGFDHTKYMNSENILDFAWNPVKINKHGTLEYRGTDMNFLSILFGVSAMYKYALKKIQHDFTIVVPVDIGVEEAFKIENNMLFIPPFSVVTRLQKKAAYDGLKNKDVHTYVKRFYKFVKAQTHEKYLPLLEPIKKMVESEKTTSDRIIGYFKRKGYKDKLSNSIVKEASIKFSEDFEKDLFKVKDKLEKIEN